MELVCDRKNTFGNRTKDEHMDRIKSVTETLPCLETA
jgi:hypothetical protein